ncbi:hypothetical protein HOP62_07925 [Halomonas sp. MCCC 1A17488]|uniref:Spy/CpxP family protein refolding chaperone n=1 Tax=unclassified Halomonas TaxID=2609666 RepID=UPI0018D20789|nr:MULTISPECIES: hypothetical protein [unclassified Halomonas]MCE8016002.1 hypothetical protein [Halomonas sp. MCCC 1A17488]MCG3239335.1 hypothetical protein [Halomonas sp. MCCC 1A17488]QPP50734.1 hypothetical protein I4484_06460 [Halomonas sp. SS10-MC5]
MMISRLSLCFCLGLALGAMASAATAQEVNSGTASVDVASPGMMSGDMGSGMMSGMMGGGMMGGGMMSGMMGGGMMSGMMGGGRMPCPMMGGGSKGALPMLDQAQRSELRELIHEHRPAQLQRLGQLMNLRDDMAVALQAERPELETLQALHARMAELQGEMLTERVRLQHRLQDLMTEEQRQPAAPETVAPDDHEAHH